MRIHKAIRLFSSQKHFIDTRYQNLMLEMQDQAGSLANLSNVFSEIGTNFSFIHSVMRNQWDQKHYALDISIEKLPEAKMNLLAQKLTHQRIKFSKIGPVKIPWFPRTLQDLNLIETSQPNDYKMGQQIPQVQYKSEQHKQWQTLYQKIREAHKGIASSRYEKNINKIQQDLRIDFQIPQLKGIHNYLFTKTKFMVKPITGILSQRDFLNALAFRTFCCNQELRSHPTFHLHEPNLLHEIIGLTPLFADPDIADIAQQIGLMSLGANNRKIVQLANLFAYIVQFGVQQENGNKKFYGAGIASNLQEIQNFKSYNAKFTEFNPFFDNSDEVPINSVQRAYRITKSLQEISQRLQHFSSTVSKPITTAYNFGTNTIEYDRCIEAIDYGKNDYL